MRKIAANYICLPGFPLVKNGYVILEQGRVKDVVVKYKDWSFMVD